MQQIGYLFRRFKRRAHLFLHIANGKSFVFDYPPTVSPSILPPTFRPSYRPNTVHPFASYIIRFIYFIIENNYVNKLGFRFKGQTVP